MSEMKRYDPRFDGIVYMDEVVDGDYVRYTDHLAALESAEQRERDGEKIALRMLSAEFKELKQQLAAAQQSLAACQIELAAALNERDEAREELSHTDVDYLNAQVKALQQVVQQARVAMNAVLADYDDRVTRFGALEALPHRAKVMEELRAALTIEPAQEVKDDPK